MVAPNAKDLSDAIGVVLKDYEGPVDVKIVSDKLQTDHPNWKLPERRVNKFVKRYMNKHKNPAGADDDQTASMYKKQTSVKGRGLLGFFSPSKRKNLVSDPVIAEEQLPESEAAPPTPKAEDAGKDPASPDGKEADNEPDSEQVTAEVPSKDIAYETDNDVVDSHHDCWGLSCSVM